MKTEVHWRHLPKIQKADAMYWQTYRRLAAQFDRAKKDRDAAQKRMDAANADIHALNAELLGLLEGWSTK